MLNVLQNNSFKMPAPNVSPKHTIQKKNVDKNAQN